MLLQGKKTFKEFSTSPEGIAPGILSSRLKWLEENELFTKQKLPDNKKENIYLLTEKGIELAPIITEIILWSDKICEVKMLKCYRLPKQDFIKTSQKLQKAFKITIVKLFEKL